MLDEAASLSAQQDKALAETDAILSGVVLLSDAAADLLADRIWTEIGHSSGYDPVIRWKVWSRVMLHFNPNFR